MSLVKSHELIKVSKIVCRELRRKETPAEKILWQMLRNRKLLGKKFYRQYPIFHDFTGKETFFVADFYCFENKLIIELDGQIHNYRLKEDAARTEFLNFLGLYVMRFKNEDVINDLSQVIKDIKLYFEQTNSSL